MTHGTTNIKNYKQNIHRALATSCSIFLSSGLSDRDKPFNIANVRTSETCDSPPSSAISVLRIKFYAPYTRQKEVLVCPEFKFFKNKLEILLTHTMKHKFQIYQKKKKLLQNFLSTRMIITLSRRELPP